MSTGISFSSTTSIILTPPPIEKPFDWIRGRQVGGRTITWGRQSYRLSDYEFKAASRDGYGDDWPISYAELAPYYDKVEEFIGVSGAYENIPNLPDGKFLPAMKMTCGERLLKKSRRAPLERSPGDDRPRGDSDSEAQRARGVSLCGHCDRGCSTYSYFSSPGSTLPAAAKTGRLTLRTNAVASHVIVDVKTGKAKGIACIDQVTRKAFEVFWQSRCAVRFDY